MTQPVTLKDSLPVIPASFFGMVFGILGLGNCWRVATRIWALPSGVGEALMLIGSLVWAVLVMLFLAKWFVRGREARAEFEDPIQCCFVGLVPVSTMLVALAALPYYRSLAFALFSLGVSGTVLFAIYRTGQLWMGGRDPASTTPVLYLPSAAGCFVIAIVSGEFGYAEWAPLAFGAGLFAWVTIESVLIHRLYTVNALPPVLRPTLGIQLAPPSVGTVAYLSITSGNPDLAAYGFIGYGLLQAVILIRLLPWILIEPFAISYWAFTFGGTALPLACLLVVERGDKGPIALLAPALFAIANVVILGIGIGTILLLLKGRLRPRKATAPRMP
jgi:tellurite resistance protein